MSPSKPADFSLLLEVFRQGLALGIISKEDVVGWADQIIIEEDEPDYFFIEIALAGSKDGLITLIDDRFTRSFCELPVRVIFGLIYDRLKNDPLNFEKYLSTVDKYNYQNCSKLTSYESTCIYSFEYYEGYFKPRNITFLMDDVLDFLSLYQDFRLDNFNEWETINNGVEEAIKVKEGEWAKLDEIATARYRKPQYRPVLTTNTIIIKPELLRGLFIVLPLLSLIIVIRYYEPIGSTTTANKLLHDIYQFSVLLLQVFFGYYLMWVFYWVGKGVGWVFGGKM